MLDTPTKALWSGAAVAAILVAGLYLWKEYSAYTKEAEWKERVTRERTALLQFIGGDSSEDDRLRNVCIQARNILKNSPENTAAQQRVASCQIVGY